MKTSTKLLVRLDYYSIYTSSIWYQATSCVVTWTTKNQKWVSRFYLIVAVKCLSFSDRS
ncbi:MAG: hypothetical protein HWQ40_26985 [Nostoc sp. NMS9]|nr:hypothetical protein [Nostoc sp. NMS9]